jgi:hypothetical protein
MGCTYGPFICFFTPVLSEVELKLQRIWIHKKMGKSLDNPPPMGVGSHHPQPMKPDVLPPELSKIGQITPGGSFGRLFATVTTILYFFLFCYFG